MAQDERTMQGRGPESPAASPPGYGGISEGTVGDPSAAGQPGAPARPAAPPQGEGAPSAREQAARGQDVEEGDAAQGEPPREGGSSNEAIPGVLDESKPLNPESSADHKSSWPDEGGTGEAGAG